VRGIEENGALRELVAKCRAAQDAGLRGPAEIADAQKIFKHD
jgi:hypothetical protein